jgi:4-hydroxybenzoate polyprenyltransferase
MTAWVIGILYFSKYPLNHFPNSNYSSNQNVRFFRLSVLYAGFAFVISLIREVVKDLEDMEGDRKYGGRTMPIVWGVNASKVFISVWLIVLITTLVILQLYVIQLGWWFSILYCFVLIVAPLIYVFKKLFSAHAAADYHHLSIMIKMVMFTGILSMIFFRYYQ